MSRIAAWALIAAALNAWPTLAAQSAPGLAKQLIQGCLGAQSKAEVVALAHSVGATPYSAARLARGKGKSDTAIFPDASKPGEAQRTRTTVNVFLGWDLPGPGAGSLEYREDTTRID